MVDDIIFATYSSSFLDTLTASGGAQLDIMFNDSYFHTITGTQSSGETNYAYII
jgi:hypothetical protein